MWLKTVFALPMDESELDHHLTVKCSLPSTDYEDGSRRCAEYAQSRD
jgi:hypothetical protein